MNNIGFPVKGKFLRIKSVSWCSRCIIHRNVAGPIRYHNLYLLMHGVRIFSLNLIKNCIDFFGKILKSASTLGDFRRIGCSHIQSCKWNERSLNRGLNRGQGLGSDVPFFGIHVRTSKSTRTFKFRTNSVLVSPRRFLKRSRSCSIAIEANTHPAPTAHPPKISGIVCSVEILGP